MFKKKKISLWTLGDLPLETSGRNCHSVFSHFTQGPLQAGFCFFDFPPNSLGRCVASCPARLSRFNHIPGAMTLWGEAPACAVNSEGRCVRLGDAPVLTRRPPTCGFLTRGGRPAFQCRPGEWPPLLLGVTRGFRLLLPGILSHLTECGCFTEPRTLPAMHCYPGL